MCKCNPATGSALTAARKSKSVVVREDQAEIKKKKLAAQKAKKRRARRAMLNAVISELTQLNEQRGWNLSKAETRSLAWSVLKKAREAAAQV